MKTYKNSNLTKRDYECTNIVACDRSIEDPASVKKAERASTLAEVIDLVKDSDGDLDFVLYRLNEKYLEATKQS